MRELGFTRFRLVGHDRGARVAHRLCLDHPEAVERVAVLDISPTRIMYAGTDMAFATAYYHWFFLIQPFDLPERLIGADPIYYLRKKLAGWSSGLSHFDPRALAEYERCFANPATIHATLRGLSRRGDDRSRARCGGWASARGVPAPRAVGNEGRGQPAVRPDHRLERRRARRARQGGAVGAFPRRGGAGGDAWPNWRGFSAGSAGASGASRRVRGSVRVCYNSQAWPSSSVGRAED